MWYNYKRSNKYVRPLGGDKQSNSESLFQGVCFPSATVGWSHKTSSEEPENTNWLQRVDRQQGGVAVLLHSKNKTTLFTCKVNSNITECTEIKKAIPNRISVCIWFVCDLGHSFCFSRLRRYTVAKIFTLENVLKNFCLCLLNRCLSVDKTTQRMGTCVFFIPLPAADACCCLLCVIWLNQRCCVTTTGTPAVLTGALLARLRVVSLSNVKS